MARLTGVIISDDERFRMQLTGLLRAGAIPVSVADRRVAQEGASPDLVIVDGCGHIPSAMATVERLRAGSGSVGIFVVASEATPEAILQAMRAGANEFFTWPPGEQGFHDGVARAAARRESSLAGRPHARMLVFFGAKGGAGTTTVSVNCGVELARLGKRPTVIVDLKPGLGEVALFLGMRSRYTLLDALDNLHRLDGEFLRELLARHKSGLEILAGSDQFERPGAADSGAIEEVFRLLARQHEYVLVDAGSQVNACSVAALYNADTIYLVTNPDVASIRNAHRLVERIGQLGACSERIRVLLNRAAEPYPIPPAQIEGAVGRPVDHTFPSDYKTVSAALNSGVPLSLTGHSDIAGQFDRFTRRILDIAVERSDAGRRGALGLQRLASIW